jgi:hypothetical protein
MQRPEGLLARIRQRLQNVLDAKFPLVPAVESTRSPRWRSLVGSSKGGVVEHRESRHGQDGKRRSWSMSRLHIRFRLFFAFRNDSFHIGCYQCYQMYDRRQSIS